MLRGTSCSVIMRFPLSPRLKLSGSTEIICQKRRRPKPNAPLRISWPSLEPMYSLAAVEVAIDLRHERPRQCHHDARAGHRHEG